MTYKFSDPPFIVKLALAHGARTHVLSKLWHIPVHKCKEIYRNVLNQSPPSGRKPDSLEWYFSPQAQVASSFLMMLYDKILATCNDRVEAFVLAYDAYVRYISSANGLQEYCDDAAAMNINRWFYLWQTMMTARKYHDDPSKQEVSFATCRSCQAKMLVPAHQIKSTFKCPLCDGSLSKSEKHMTYRFRRDVAKATPVAHRPVV